MIKNRIHILLAERYMSVAKLCKLTGISRGSLYPLYNNVAKSIAFEQIDKICDVLNITPSELFEYTPNKANQ